MPTESERISTIPTLPRRSPDSHKGRYGTVLVVAGGRGMAGAAALVGASSLRSGAGLVRVATPDEVQPTVASFEPCYMTYPLASCPAGLLQFEQNRDDLSRLMASADVLAVGPGLGRSAEVTQLVGWLLQEASLPMVLDADALNALAETGLELVREREGPLILTPHPGEFARLVGKSVSEIQKDREAQAMALAQTAASTIVVLKGANTVVTDGRRLYINKSGNPGMATGGSGDVLTGVIAALVAQRLPAFEACVLGSHVHGLAGDIARDQNGEIGMIAGDIVDSLPDAFYHLSSLDPGE